MNSKDAMNSMNCMDALDALLTTDFPSVTTGTRVDLREHLHGCRRCQAVAASLQSQTEALAALTRAVPVRSRPVGGVAVARSPRVAMLAVAALLLVVLWPQARQLGPKASTEQQTVAMSVPAPTDVGAVALEANDAASARQLVPTAVPPTEPVRTRAPAATAAAPALSKRSEPSGDPRTRDLGTPIAAPRRVEAVPLLAVEVAVDPATEFAPDALDIADAAPARGKPVLLPQRNPNITVFWVY